MRSVNAIEKPSTLISRALSGINNMAKRISDVSGNPDVSNRTWGEILAAKPEEGPNAYKLFSQAA